MTGNGPFFNADYAMLLSNRVDFVYTVACYTGGFDMAEPSLSEGFLRSRGGALGYIGCSRYGWDYNMCAYGTTSGTSDWCLTGILRGQSLQYAVEFQKRIYGLDKDGNTFERDTTLGAAFMNHKAAFASKWSDLYTLWLTFYINLQGDPLLTYHLPPRETGTAADSAESGLVTLLRDRPVAVSANSATVRLAADEIVLGKTAAVSLEYSTSPQFSSVTTVPVGDFTQQAETEKTITGLSPATTYYVRAKSVIGQTHMSPFSLSFTTLPANTVGGTVLDAGGTPVANVTVRAKDGSGTVVGTTQTGADGVYALTLSAGWTGTVEIVAPKGFAAGAAVSVTIPSGGSATADFTLTKVVYVNGRASGKNDGTSWADAFTTLPAALKVAAAGDQVWVAEGVYTPEEIAAYGRDCHFAPASGVFVYGGFAGNETSLSARDWIAHPTVLSGDIGTKGNASDNCLHLIRYAAGALFDGFGLTGANLDDVSNISQIYSTYGAIVGTPESNPSAKVVGDPYPQFGENPGSMSGPIFFDHCAVTNNSATANSYDGANLVGNGIKAVFRNSLIAHNTVNNASRNGMMDVTLLDNCTVTANSTVVAPFSSARLRNTIVVGNTQSSSCGAKTVAESGTDGNAGRQRVVFMWIAKASSGSDKFMSESFYRMSNTTGLDIPSDAWYPAATSADVGWTTKDGFAYALGEESGAAEKGKVLEWMTEDTLDYLGNPRVHGTAPDLGCCEAVADSGGDDDDDDDDDDDEEIVRPEDAPVRPENEINAMTWEMLFPTAKTYADSATSFTLPYRQHSPTTADGVKYPLVIFLHGAGEIGTDNAKQVQTENDVIPITKYAMKHGDAFVLAPQCPGASGNDYSLTWSGANWNSYPMTRLETPTKPMAAVVKLVTEFIANNPVDPTRVYVTGLSMGGFGTWDLASRMSDTFAAVMPCCGGADPNAASLYDDGMAIRFFHGSSDNVVSPNFSRGMDTALTTAGIEHDYIEYSGVNHVDCWRKAYVDTEDNLEWLFGHIKGEEYVAPDHGDTTPNAPLSTVANGGWLGWKLAGDGSSIVDVGTKVWAYAQNYCCRQGRLGANLVVNDVEFTKSGGFASDDTGIKNHISCDKTFGYGRDNFGTEDLSDGASDFARMIKTGWEATGDQGPVQTYTLHGLTYGKMYLVQFIYHCASPDRAMLSVIAPGGTVSTRVNGWDANGQNLDENWRYGGSLIGVFTASGSDQTITITYSRTANYLLNAVQLREVTVSDLADGPAIVYGTPTIGSVTPSVNGTTATLTLANVASGENGGCYQVWLAYAEDGATLGAETAALISQQSSSCAVEIPNLTPGRKYNYSLYVKNEGNVISAKKTGSFTMPGGEEPVDSEDIENPTSALVNHFTFNLSSRRFYDCIQERDAVLIDKDLATIENLSVADVPSTVTDYNKAIALPQNTGLKVAHSIPTNAAHPYCLVIRFYSPLASHGTWRALYQTIQENNTDASLFLQNSNDGGIGKGGETSWRGYYGSVSDDVWHSLVVSVDTVNSVSALYLDGTKIREISSASGPNDLTGRPYIYFGLDNDGEDNTLYFDDIRIYNEAKPLAVFDGDSVRAGGPDDTIGEEDPVEPGEEVWTAIPMTSNGSVFSTDGDLVFAFSRDRGDPGTTYENSSTPVTFNYLNSLTDEVTNYHNWQYGGKAVNGPYDNGLQPADYLAASPVLNGANGNCGDEGLGTDMSGFGSMLGCMWTGPSLSGTDGKATFTFKRLTSGHKYLVEFFIHDHDQAKSITSPDGKATIYYGGTGWQYGGVLRGTFVATADTHDIVLTYSDPDSYGMGAIQLRDLGVAPEDPDDPQDETIASAAAKLGLGRWLAMPLTGDPADFITEGTLAVISSKNMAGSRKYESDSTVQNIPFGGSNKANDHMVGNPAFSGNKDCGSGADCGLTGAYGNILKYGWSGASAAEYQTVSFSGFDPAKTYLVQYIIHGELNVTNRYDEVTDVTGTHRIWQSAASAGEKWYYGGTLIHVFKPDSNGNYTLQIAHRSVDNNGTVSNQNGLMNAYQIREVTREEQPEEPPEEPEEIPVYALTIPAKTGLVIGSVTTNGAAVAGTEGVYSIVSNTEVTITFTAASGYELDDNDGVVTKTIESNYTFVDADYPAVKEQGGEEPVDPPSGEDVWTATPMTSNGSVFSTDGDLVFAFSRDRGDPGTTYENSSTPVTFNYINSLTDTVTKYHPWQHGGEAIDGPYGNGLQPADYLAASPVLNGANGNCGDEGLGSDMSGFGSMLGCMWTGPSLSGTDNKATFTFKRLTSGHKYLVEFFIHDHDQVKSITSPDGKATIYYGGTGWQYGGVLRGTFVATAATQDIVLTYSDPGSYGMGAIQLRDLGGVTPPKPKLGFILIVR